MQKVQLVVLVWLVLVFCGLTFSKSATIKAVGVDDPKVRLALEELFWGTSGLLWNRSTYWGSDVSYCSWYGVNCVSGYITSLQLKSNNLAGKLPNSIGVLVNLTLLDLSTNRLTGEVPESIGDMRNLNTLRLNGNNLTGFLSYRLGSLSKLSVLDVSRNQLSGYLPSSFSDLRLSELRLDSNRFSGSLPFYLVNAVRSFLVVSNNQFTHIHMSEPQLSTCSFQNNPFVCPIPQWAELKCYAKCTSL